MKMVQRLRSRKVLREFELISLFIFFNLIFISGSHYTMNQNINYMSDFPPLSLSMINCNSLNVSSIGTMSHKVKLYGITKLGSDIIFLSDIRLCNSRGISSNAPLYDTFRINPYYSFGLRLISWEGYTVRKSTREQRNLRVFHVRNTGKGVARKSSNCPNTAYGSVRSQPRRR